MLRVRISLALSLFMLIASPLFAAGNAQQSGQQLVRKLFADMKSGNVTAIEAMISPAFQSVHQDGARDRDQEIELIRNLKMGTLALGDFKESREGNVLVVTYTVSTEEMIDGKRFSGEPTWRLTVFQKTEQGWRWVAHANLKGMG